MANSPSIHLLLLMACLIIISSPIIADAGGDPGFAWLPATAGKPCRGSIAECMAEGEFEMDSDINRRTLATAGTISYGALNADSVPCSQRGKSYYSNCEPGSGANPYSRDCSQVTRCDRAA